MLTPLKYLRISSPDAESSLESRARMFPRIQHVSEQG